MSDCLALGSGYANESMGKPDSESKHDERKDVIMAEQRLADIELKETVERQRFLEILHQWVQAIERKQDFEVRVKGETHRIPADAIERGRLQVEYEIDNGEYEFELTLKWR